VQNLFRMLGASFGREDFFTASLALFLDRNEALRDAFLGWIQRWTTEDLRARSWKVSAQVRHPSRAGEAIIDMVLANPEVELWFEHKVGSSAGPRTTDEGEEIDQLEKYLDAAARRMQGIPDGKTPAPWPERGPTGDRPRVLLFYITRDAKTMDRARYGDRLAGERGYGLAWPPQGHLRWRDFWHRACVALEGALGGEQGEFERTLTRAFLDYWRGMPGMWLQHCHDLEWHALLSAPKGERARFERFWSRLQAVAAQRLGWRRTGGYGGVSIYLSAQHDWFDWIEVSVVTDLEKQPEAAALGDQVLSLLLRPTRDPEWPPFDQQAPAEFERWRGRLLLHRLEGQNRLRLLVSIPAWGDCLNDDERDRAVAAAFVAGLRMFVDRTGIEIPGLVPAEPHGAGGSRATPV
jgi:hypothetical protein